jgi:hypothetical protein
VSGSGKGKRGRQVVASEANPVQLVFLVLLAGFKLQPYRPPHEQPSSQ